MGKKLTNNLFLKILSVIFAFVLWLVVVNINDPDITRSITGIPITIINEEKITEQGQIYYIESPVNQYGSVTVKGARSILDNLKGSDIKATVDFGDVSSVGAITINYTLPEGVSLVTKRVEVMRIVTEELKSDTFSVEIETKGSTADGYLLGDAKVSPNRVRITAPESILNLVKKVVVEVDVDGMSTDIAAQSDLHLYDGNGMEINYLENKNITISATTLSVNINMLRTQTKLLQLEVSGEVQDGYRFLGMNCDVSGVAVKGLPSKMRSFSIITIPASSGELDISELTEETEVLIDLNRYLPDGISLLNEEDRYIIATLNVQQLYERDLYIPIDEIRMDNVPEEMDLNFNTEAVAVARFEGLYDDIYAITIEELNPRVSLSGLSEGTHRLTVTLDVPEEAEHKNTTDIYVTLTQHVEETQEESDELEEAIQDSLDASATSAVSGTSGEDSSLEEEGASGLLAEEEQEDEQRNSLEIESSTN